jgi:hypothetical protein
MFFVTSFISIPPSIQDMVIHMGTTAVSGYTALVHVRLYKIYPVLVVVPTVILAAIVHFWVQSNKVQQKLEFARLFGTSNEEKSVDVDGNLNKIVPREVPASSLMPLPVSESVSRHINRRQSVAHGIDIAAKARQELSSHETSSHSLYEDSHVIMSQDRQIMQLDSWDHEESHELSVDVDNEHRRSNSSFDSHHLSEDSEDDLALHQEPVLSGRYSHSQSNHLFDFDIPVFADSDQEKL